MITDKDIEKMQKVFTTSQDHVRLEEKVDKIVGIVNELPTRDEMERMLERTYGFSVWKAEHERIKKLLRERFNVEI